MIEISRNSIVIRNVDEQSDAFRKFKSRFSVWDPVTHKYTFSAFYNIGADYFIPSSVGINEIKALFPKKEVIEKVDSFRSKAIYYEMKNQPRDELQTKAIKFLSTMKSKTGSKERFLGLNTGAGKTYIITNIGQVLKK